MRFISMSTCFGPIFGPSSGLNLKENASLDFFKKRLQVAFFFLKKSLQRRSIFCTEQDGKEQRHRFLLSPFSISPYLLINSLSLAKRTCGSLLKMFSNGVIIIFACSCLSIFHIFEMLNKNISIDPSDLFLRS